MAKSHFTWKPFYRELADKVLPYKNRRDDLVRIINNVYSTIDQKNPLKSNNQSDTVKDLDPFTLLALINRGITEENRKIALTEFKRVFNIRSAVPSDFDGVPQLNNMRAWFFSYEAGNKTNGTAEIDTLWAIFVEAHKYVNNKKNKLAKTINDALALHLVKWNITLGLFWFFSDTFVALDDRTRTYLISKNIYTKEQLESSLADAKNYLTICKEVVGKVKAIDSSVDNFCDLSAAAYVLAEQTKLEEKQTAYFLISADPSVFAFETMTIGDTIDFTYVNDDGHKRKIPRNFKNAKSGDKVLCYDARPTKKIVSLAEIIENKADKYILLKKTHNLETPIDYETFMAMPIMADSEYVRINRGTLFKLTKDQYDALLNLTTLTEDGGDVSSVLPRNGYNKIFYGLPGCGKSYLINSVVLKDVKAGNYIRTTFYQDYSYSDFVGQIMPISKVDENGNRLLTYEFRPGPFVEALEKAYKNPSETIYLIIEELNRGNAPSIFGDLFQLLDREHNDPNNIGESQYPINSKLISDYLDCLPDKYDGKVFIPNNLVILATMNTSDQNVFTLDTAFKRRWEFEEVKNNFSSHPYASMFVPGTEVTWEMFVNVINRVIIDLQTNMSSSEDKRLGAYFVTKNELADSSSADIAVTQRFAYKVLEYLWDDVARFNRDQIFKAKYRTLTDLIEDFVGDIKLGVFAESISFDDEN